MVGSIAATPMMPVLIFAGPSEGSVVAVPRGCWRFRIYRDDSGPKVIFERGDKIETVRWFHDVLYFVRPAPEGVEQLWIAVPLGSNRLLQGRCAICCKLARYDSLFENVAGEAVCDLCIWDAKSWARSDRMAA